MKSFSDKKKTTTPTVVTSIMTSAMHSLVMQYQFLPLAWCIMNTPAYTCRPSSFAFALDKDMFVFGRMPSSLINPELDCDFYRSKWASSLETYIHNQRVFTVWICIWLWNIPLLNFSVKIGFFLRLPERHLQSSFYYPTTTLKINFCLFLVYLQESYKGFGC